MNHDDFDRDPVETDEFLGEMADMIDLVDEMTHERLSGGELDRRREDIMNQVRRQKAAGPTTSTTDDTATATATPAAASRFELAAEVERLKAELAIASSLAAEAERLTGELAEACAGAARLRDELNEVTTHAAAAGTEASERAAAIVADAKRMAEQLREKTRAEADELLVTAQEIVMEAHTSTAHGDESTTGPRIRTGLGDLQQKLREITASAMSQDGLIAAIVGPRGQLIKLAIDGRIYRRPDSTELATAIIETVQRATAEAMAQVAEACKPYMADEEVRAYLDGDFAGVHRSMDSEREFLSTIGWPAGLDLMTPAGMRPEGPQSGTPTQSSVNQQPRPADATQALIELHRAANAVRRHVEQAVLRQENLTWTGFVILREVWAAKKLETRHAAERVGISKATLTGVVDTLVRRGLVRRDRHPEDGRMVVVELTRRGRRLIQRLLPASWDEEEFTLGYLDEEGIVQVAAVLQRLVAHLDAEPALSNEPTPPVKGTVLAR